MSLLVPMLVSVLTLWPAALGQCPINCRCSDYVRKTYCLGTCNASLPTDVNPNTVDFSAVNYNLTVLRRAHLRGLPNLTDLSLDDNHVFAVEADAFRDLPRLVALSLQDNLFEKLDRDLVAFNSQLVVLYLSQSSQLRFPIDGNFLDSSSLKSLFLENCRKMNTRLDQATGSEVRVLDARHFAGLPNLKELSVRNSGIDVLEVSAPTASWGLVTFNLRNNFLETIPREFFARFVSLETLYLDNNKLEVLPAGVFDPLKTLKKLFLGSNNLESLDEKLFWSLGSLELLDLSENSLSKLEPELFRDLAGLRSLLLGGNMLENLDASLMSPLKDLESLDVSDNKLKAVDAAWFSGLYNLEEVRISGLASTCDCALRHFWQEMSASGVQVLASCGSSPQLSNHSFTGLNCAPPNSSGFFASSPAVWISVGTSLALVFVALVAAGTYVYCRRRERATAKEASCAYRTVPSTEIYALPMKPNNPRPPPRPPRLVHEDD